MIGPEVAQNLLGLVAEDAVDFGLEPDLDQQHLQQLDVDTAGGQP